MEREEKRRRGYLNNEKDEEITRGARTLKLWGRKQKRLLEIVRKGKR